MHTEIADELRSFYAALAELEGRQGGMLRLDACKRSHVAARQGVYFFFEDGEMRAGSGSGHRVVRVGTHAVTTGSKSTLWGRLRQHRGVGSGGGNQRGSIFRRHVGAALMDAGLVEAVDGWLIGSNATASQRLAERKVEDRVSLHIRRMPFLFLPVEDAAGPDSARHYIERNAIALLSSPAARALDPPSAVWLGHHARRAAIRESGLWNVNYVGESVDPAFRDRLRQRVREVE